MRGKIETEAKEYEQDDWEWNNVVIALPKSVEVVWSLETGSIIC